VSFGGSDRDVLLLKFDANGRLLWTGEWGGDDGDYGDGIGIDVEDSLYVTGATDSFGGAERDALLLKYDASGSLLWSGTPDGGGGDAAVAVTTDSNLGVYVVGATGAPSAIDSDSMVLKYGPHGDLVSSRNRVGNAWEWAITVASEVGRNIYTAGHAPSNTGSRYDLTGVALIPDGVAGSPQGTVGFPEGTESSPEGVVDTGGGERDALLLKNFPSQPVDSH